MKKQYFNVFYWLSLILLLSAIILISWHNLNKLPLFIKKNDKIEKNQYFSHLMPIISHSPSDFQLFVYLGNLCGTCNSGRLMFYLDSLQSHVKDVKINILLPLSFSERDLENIKYNNSLEIDFYHISKKFQRNIDKTKNNKRLFPYHSFAFLSNKYGIVLHSDYIFSKKIAVEKKVAEFLNKIHRSNLKKHKN